MKKLLLIFSFLLCLQAGAQSLNGKWKGSLQAGPVKLTLVLNIDESAKNVTLDVIEQGAEKIPMTVNMLGNDSVNVSIPSLALNYAGKLNGGEINGVFIQQGFSAPLDFKRGDVVNIRPQEPKPPFPYSTETVEFVNGKAGVKLCGTLTMPAGYVKNSKVPVVLMVTGSGAQNRDEEVFRHKPFLVIADWLARNGIASLRYDDRGTAMSTGSFAEATTYDFADDAQAGTEWLRRNGQFSKVGILGHSEGGLIAYMLGAKGCADFIVSLAGPACRIDTMMMVQINAIARAQGAPYDVLKDVKQTRDFFVKNGTPWNKTFIDIDAAPAVKNVKCPVLALGGDRDLNVPVSINAASLEASLPKAKHNAIKVYKGLNHFFQHAETGSPTESANIEETISTDVLSDIVSWIKEL